MEAMERLTEEDVRKLTVAQTNVLCHWLCIPYGAKTGTTVERRERACTKVREEEARQRPKRVWKAFVEHSMTESMPAFDKKIRETGPWTPWTKETVEVRYLSLPDRTAGGEQMSLGDLVGTQGVE